MTSNNDDYAPSPTGWVRTQVEKVEAAGTTDVVDIMGMPVVLLTMRGAKSGKLRKVPLMRVEHNGVYAAVASYGGSPQHPVWYHNVVAHPEVELQDGPEPHTYRARIAEGEERAIWWKRAVEVYAPYAGYQEKTDREIPVFLLERVS